jgi:hypothetical protein
MEDRQECLGLLRPEPGEQYTPLSYMVLAYSAVISNEILEGWELPSAQPIPFPLNTREITRRLGSFE